MNGDHALRAAKEGQREENNFEKRQEAYQKGIERQKVGTGDHALAELEV